MYLDVGDGHRIHYERYGNPTGKQFLFLHGGPGLGFSEHDKLFFDSQKFNVIFLDQRGAGKSTPKGRLTNNTTQDLLSDIDKVLDHLEVETTAIFAGSWGATLAILYAAKNGHRVNQLILRGFFPGNKACVDIYHRGLIQKTHPDAWDRISSFVPEEHKDLVPEYIFEKIKISNSEAKILGSEWSRYGLALSRKKIFEEEVDRIISGSLTDLDKIKLEFHYTFNAFFIAEGYVLEQAKKIKNIPTTIVHGSHDYLCPVSYAKELAATIPQSKLVLVDAGHSTSEPLMKEALLSQLNEI